METIANNNVAMNNNAELNATKRTDIYQIDPRNIVVVEGFNARRDFALGELKEQIRKQGVLNPITVISFKDEDGNEKYRLVDGERRYRAVMELLAEGADIRRVKAMYLPKNTKEEDMYIQQMMRNEGRNFTEYECAILFNMFKEKYGYTQTEIAEKFGKKTSFVSRCLSLLDVAPELQDKMEKGEISTDAVRTIINNHKDDEKAQVEAVEKAVKEAKAKGKKTATAKDVAPNIQVANLIAKMRKDMKKVAALLGEMDNERATAMMEYFAELHTQTSEFEYMAKNLTNEEVDEIPVENVVENTDTTETEMEIVA